MNLIYPPQSIDGLLTRAETGQFATTGALDATGAYLTNLIASISGGGGSDPALVTGASGVLQVQIDSINSAGYLSSGQADLRFIHLTGNETISGTKIFRAVQVKSFAGDGIVFNIDGISGTYLLNTGAGASINLLDSQLKDVVNNPKLDWQNNTLTGVWFVQDSNDNPKSIVNFALLTNTSGALATLINSSAAGVSTLNTLSGALSLAGTGNVVITTDGQTILISGIESTGSFYDLPYFYVASTSTGAYASGSESVAIGPGSYTQGSGILAIGYKARATFNHSVALGSNSIVQSGSISYTPYNQNDVYTSYGEVSIGHTGQTRRVTNVSPGVNEFDAATINQITGLYPKSNPSNYITGISTGEFVTRQETGQFYPSSNPQSYASSGFVVGTSGVLRDLISANAAGVSSLNGLSGIVDLLGTGNVFLSINGQNIIISGSESSTNVDLSGYITTGDADLRYYFLTNPQNYIRSGDVLTSLSGYVGTGETGVFALKTDLTQTGVLLKLSIDSLSGYGDRYILASGESLFYFTTNLRGMDNSISLSGALSKFSVHSDDAGLYSELFHDIYNVLLSTGISRVTSVPCLDFDFLSSTASVGAFANPNRLVLDFGNRGLSGSWSTDTTPSNYNHIINLGYLSGVSGVLASQGGGISLSDLYSNPFIVFKTGNQSISGTKTFISDVVTPGVNTERIYTPANSFEINTQNGIITNPIGLQVIDLPNRSLNTDWSTETNPTVGANIINLGYLSGVSGVLRTLIAASSAGVSTLNDASGTLTLIGTGNITVIPNGQNIFISGTSSAGGGTKTYSRFTPLDNQSPGTGFATLDTRNSIALLDFDDSVQEQAIFVDIMPEAASLGSGLTIRIIWAATSATSGATCWGAQFMKLDSGTDIDSDSFDTAVTSTTTAPGTSGQTAVTSITITTIDSIAAGDAFRLKIYRDVADGGDTMVGDAELIAVEIRSAA